MDAQTRRNFLNRTSMGLGALATASIAQDSDLLARGLQTKPGTACTFQPKPSVSFIYTCPVGLLIWTLDNKPQMQKHHGDPYLSRSLENND